jgi:predicted ester cyclase
MATVEDNKATVRRFIEEVLNEGNYHLIEGYYASPELASHIKGDAPQLRRAFPDLHFVIEDLFGEGDKVVVRFTVGGTNDGPFMGRPPTGKTARWSGVTINTFKDGKVTEEWVMPDILSIMKQLGMVPATLPRHASQTEGVPAH